MSRWARSTDDENLQSVVKWGTQDIPRALRNPPYDGRSSQKRRYELSTYRLSTSRAIFWW